MLGALVLVWSDSMTRWITNVKGVRVCLSIVVNEHDRDAWPKALRPRRPYRSYARLLCRGGERRDQDGGARYQTEGADTNESYHDDLHAIDASG